MTDVSNQQSPIRNLVEHRSENILIDKQRHKIRSD